MEIFIVWIVLALLVGLVGKGRKIGFGWALFWALLLSPLIGVFIALYSDIDNGPVMPEKWAECYEIAERAEYKNQIDTAIDSYMDALYYLEKNIDDLTRSEARDRKELTAKIKNKVQTLKRNKIESALKT